MKSPRRKLAVYIVMVLAIVMLLAIPIWLGTGPVVLAPGIDR